MDEHDPVGDHEFVYRRIHPRFWNLSLPTPVQLQAFRPTESDTTGLSVFRASFAKPEDTLALVDPAEAKYFAVVRLAVADLCNLGLTVIPEPLAGGPPGHAVIPELTWHGYHHDKTKWKSVLRRLAELASAGLILPPGVLNG